MEINKHIGLTIDDCFEVLQNADKDQQYDKESISFEIKHLSDTPQGFVGEHFILTINYKSQGQEINESKSNKFFLKNLNGTSDIIRMMDESLNAYEREAFLYHTFLKEGEAMGIDISFAPKGYFARPRFLIMEDISKTGFCTGNKLQQMTISKCRAVLDELAKFHMFVVIYEYEKRKVNKSYSFANDRRDFILENLQKDGKANVYERWFQPTMDGLLATIDLLSDEDCKDGIEKEVFKRRLRQYLVHFYDDLTPKKDDLCCLLHNDLWCNNIMFQYPLTTEASDFNVNNTVRSKDLSSADPIDCKLIDYQLLSYGSPAADVMRLLHMNTRQMIRDKHREELLQYYFQRTIQILQDYGLNANNLSNWTWDIFSSTCDRIELATKLRCTAARCMTLMPESISVNWLQKPDGHERVLFTDRIPIMLEAYTVKSESGDLYQRVIGEDIRELWRMLKERSLKQNDDVIDENAVVILMNSLKQCS